MSLADHIAEESKAERHYLACRARAKRVRPLIEALKPGAVLESPYGTRYVVESVEGGYVTFYRLLGKKKMETWRRPVGVVVERLGICGTL